MSKQPKSLADVAVQAPPEDIGSASEPSTPAVAPLRVSLHVRVAPGIVERVREAAHRLRRDKQDIAEEALREWLDRNRF